MGDTSSGSLRVRFVGGVDDDALGRSFADDDVTVDFEATAEDVLASLLSDPVDCVVSRYDLPDATGVELLRDVREIHPDLPFVLVPTDGSEALAAEAIEAGVTRYVPGQATDSESDAIADAIANAVDRSTRTRGTSHFEAIAKTAADAIVTIDEDSTVRFANPAVETVLGHDPDAIEGEPLTTLMPERMRDAHRTAIDRYLETGERSFNWNNLELPGLHADGHEVPLSITFSEFDRDGDHYFTGIIRDVTERVAAQHALERQNERLEEFAGIVSHDLKTPLTVINGSIELADKTGEQQHYDRARTAVDRMQTLIEDLLSLARDGKPVDDPESVSLEETVTRVWTTTDTAAASLVVERDGTVLADPGRLDQLFENLVRNAIEHGGSDVTVSVGHTHGENGSGFFVADDGAGIPEAERDQVFESGYTTDEDGTGFGLNIVHEIADAHGWTVTATESDAGGARFEITDVEFVEPAA